MNSLRDIRIFLGLVPKESPNSYLAVSEGKGVFVQQMKA